MKGDAGAPPHSHAYMLKYSMCNYFFPTTKKERNGERERKRKRKSAELCCPVNYQGEALRVICVIPNCYSHRKNRRRKKRGTCHDSKMEVNHQFNS